MPIMKVSSACGRFRRSLQIAAMLPVAGLAWAQALRVKVDNFYSGG